MALKWHLLLFLNIDNGCSVLEYTENLHRRVNIYSSAWGFHCVISICINKYKYLQYIAPRMFMLRFGGIRESWGIKHQKSTIASRMLSNI